MAGTEAEKLERYFRTLADGLPAPNHPTAPERRYRKLGTLVKAAGRKSLSPSLRKELAQAAEQAGLYTDLPLDDPTLAQDRTIFFSRGEFAEPVLLPSNESSLRDWTMLFVGVAGTLFERCYDPEVEFRIPGYGRRIDLLLRERGPAGRFKGFVVVEFENSSPAGTVAQTREYMIQLRQTPIAKGKEVRGVIISSRDHPPERRHLASLPPQHDIRWYVLDAKLRDLTTHPCD